MRGTLVSCRVTVGSAKRCCFLLEQPNFSDIFEKLKTLETEWSENNNSF